jgi:hypothetical protein
MGLLWSNGRLGQLCSSLEDNLRLMADFPESDHRYATSKAPAAVDIPLTKTRILEFVASAEGNLEARQAGLPTKHNISEIVTPLITGRWTASIDAQLQPSQMDISTLKCTLAICTSPTLCGTARSIGTSWSTFVLKVQLRAREAQTISFVTSCSTPAYVAIRNIVLPGQGGNIATVTVTQNVTTVPTSVAELPASTVTSTVVSVETGNAALGLAGSIVIMNACAHAWISIYGNDDFEHIPSMGMALVPADPVERFGPGITLQSLAEGSAFCATSSREGLLDYAFGVPLKRQEPQSPFHPTHPRYINDRFLSLDIYTFQPMDMITLNCPWENNPGSETQPSSIWSISNTGCDGVTMSGSGLLMLNFELYSTIDVSMAYAGNTVANVSLPVGVYLDLQTWSRNEPGWVDGTYSSFDGGDLENSAWTEYHIEDGEPHSVHFMCNYTTRSPSGAMTQVVYSTSTTTTSEITTSTETETQTITWPESYTITETVTSTDWSITTTTETTTEFSPTTELATTAYATETSTTDTSTTSSESSEPASEPTPSPEPEPVPQPPSPPPREYWSVNVYNRCPLGSGFSVIMTQPQISIDTMIFTYWSSVGASIVSDDANPTFLPVSGGQVCATSQRTGQQWCGYETVAAHVTSNADYLYIDCPSSIPSPPDMSIAIPLNLLNNVGRTSSSTGCNYFGYQIGCEPGNYCLGKGYENNQGENDNLNLQYPLISPGARLRVRQTDTARTQWRVTLQDSQSGSTSSVYTQMQGSWLEVTVPDTTTAITLEASCFYY